MVRGVGVFLFFRVPFFMAGYDGFIFLERNQKLTSLVMILSKITVHTTDKRNYKSYASTIVFEF
jgi:hypothetical protein